MTVEMKLMKIVMKKFNYGAYFVESM